MLIWIQILFLAINIGIGKYQANRFDKQQKRINHTLWALYYGVLLIPVWFLSHNWWLVIACGLQHIPIFNTALNWSRVPTRPIFYTHPEDPLRSKIDAFWGKYYSLVFFICMLSLIGIQFLLFF